MKAVKTAAGILCVLCALLIFPSCSGPEDHAASIRAAESKLNEEKQSLTGAESAAKSARKEADDARRRAEDSKSKADEDKAGQLANKAAGADAAVTSAKERVAAAESNLKTLKDGGSDWDVLPSWLLPLIGALLALSLLGGAAYFIYQFIKDARARNHARFESIKIQQADLRRQLENISYEFGRKVDALSTEQRGEFANLNRGLSTIRQEVETMRRFVAALDPNSRSSAHGHGQQEEGGHPAREAVRFPVPAEEYLTRIRRRGQSVKADRLHDIIIRAHDGEGEFILVADDAVPGGLLYIIPTISRFTTKQEFNGYYEKYYDCHNPTGGDIWVVEPTTVTKVDGGWQLVDKGVLEAR